MSSAWETTRDAVHMLRESTKWIRQEVRSLQDNQLTDHNLLQQMGQLQQRSVLEELHPRGRRGCLRLPTVSVTWEFLLSPSLSFQLNFQLRPQSIQPHPPNFCLCFFCPK